MSAPESRLLNDVRADELEQAATAVLCCSPLVVPALEELAAAVIDLCRDRRARQELEVARRKAA